MTEEVGLDIWNYATIIFGTGFATTLINQLASWYFGVRKEKKSRAEKVGWLALQTAVVLETFVIACAETVSTTRFHLDQSNPNLTFSMPEIGPFPTGDNWKFIPSQLASRILSFPNIRTMGTQEMDGYWETIDRDDRPRVMLGFIAKHGLIAWDIAVNLRSEYDLPVFSPGEKSWNAIECLKTERKRSPDL